MLKMTQFSNADAIRAGSRPTMGGDPAPDFSAHDASRKIVITVIGASAVSLAATALMMLALL